MVTITTDSGKKLRADLKDDINKNTEQIFSKNKLGSLRDIKGDAGSYLSQEACLEQNNQIKESNKRLYAFEKNTSQKIDEVNQINQKLINLLIKANNSTIQMNPAYFQTEINNMVDATTRILNSRDSTTKEAMLAGVNSDSNAVDDLKVFLQNTIGNANTPDYSYYKGGEGGLSINIDDNFSIDKFTVTAQDPAFEKTIRALGLCLKADPNKLAGSMEISQALDLSNDANKNDFVRVQSIVGISLQTMEKSTDLSLLKDIEINKLMDEEHFDDFYESLQNIETDKVFLELSRHFAIQELIDLRADIQAYS